MLGIYAYFDKKDNSVVYVGKDSYIDKNRRNIEHHSPIHYHRQPFNRVLQNNPNRYTYQVLVWNVKDQNTLTALEIQYIRQLKPKFNYTDGGDGVVGYKHSEEAKRKISENHKGKNNPNYGKHHSKQTKQKIGKSVMKYHLWDAKIVHYNKNTMFQKNRTPNPCKCFQLRYDGCDVFCGGFVDFTSVQLIHNLIKECVVVE